MVRTGGGTQVMLWSETRTWTPRWLSSSPRASGAKANLFCVPSRKCGWCLNAERWSDDVCMEVRGFSAERSPHLLRLCLRVVFVYPSGKRISTKSTKNGRARECRLEVRSTSETHTHATDRNPTLTPRVLTHGASIAKSSR